MKSVQFPKENVYTILTSTNILQWIQRVYQKLTVWLITHWSATLFYILCILMRLERVGKTLSSKVTDAAKMVQTHIQDSTNLLDISVATTKKRDAKVNCFCHHFTRLTLNQNPIFIYFKRTLSPKMKWNSNTR